MIRNFLGASDASTVLGLNPFKTRLQLWAEKTGRVEPPDLSDNHAVQWGIRLESVCADRFAEKHGVKLMAYKKRYVHPKYDFISCELDRLIVGTDELVEIKTVNARLWKEWSDPDTIPGYVIVQVMLQLGLSGRKRGHIFCLCGGSQEVEKVVDFDQEVYDGIVAKLVEFWKMVQDGIPPEATSEDSQVIVKLYPSKDDTLQQNEDLNAAAKQMLELKMHIDEQQKEYDEIKAKLMLVIGETSGIKTSEYTIKRIDVKACEYMVKREPTWYPRIYKNKEGK